MIRLGLLTPYMLDVRAGSFAYNPTPRQLDDPELQRPFFERHSCLSAYVVGARLALASTDNLYVPSHYREAERSAEGADRGLGRFFVDPYQYPPPFLMAPATLQRLGADFLAVRAIWYVFCVLALSAALLLVSWWLGGIGRGAHWWAWPVLMASPVVIGSLQIGNVHGVVIAAAMVSLVMFERSRPAVGGLLLAICIWTKLFPAVLLLYLLGSRAWSALVWTGLWMAGLLATSWLALGGAVHVDFITYHLPRLASGSAFQFARIHAHPILVNLAPAGLPYRLETLGVSLDARLISGLLARCMTLATAMVALWLGWRWGWRPGVGGGDRWKLGRRWLGLLVLGQLCSPFLPAVYGNIATMWLVVLMIPGIGGDRSAPLGGQWRWWLLLAALTITLCINVPLPFGDQGARLDLIYMLFVQLLTLLIGIVAIRSGSRDLG